eukprot:351952-Chlamydomonas_euryale.AAC.2
MGRVSCRSAHGSTPCPACGWPSLPPCSRINPLPRSRMAPALPGIKLPPRYEGSSRELSQQPALDKSCCCAAIDVNGIDVNP